MLNKEWTIKLQEDFPFMRQNNVEEERNTYKRWGFECSGGWYQLLRECCEAIVSRYAEDGIGIDHIDFEPIQIKEKFGTLRFYFRFKDAPCEIAALDFIDNGTGLRFESKNDNDNERVKKLHHDISLIVQEAEEKSDYTCEICGNHGELRNDSDIGIRWIQTLCDSCHEKRIRKTMEAREKRKKMSLEDML